MDLLIAKADGTQWVCLTLPYPTVEDCLMAGAEAVRNAVAGLAVAPGETILCARLGETLCVVATGEEVPPDYRRAQMVEVQPRSKDSQEAK